MLQSSVVFILVGSARSPDVVQEGPSWDGLEVLLFMIARGHACQVRTRC